MNSAKPLDNFPLVRSHSLDRVREALAAIYAKPTMMPARVDGLDATINVCELQNVGFGFRAFGVTVGLEFEPTGLFCLLLPTRGTGRLDCSGVSTELRPGGAAVISSDWHYKGHYSADYEHLALVINERSMTEKLGAMLGAPISDPLRLQLRQDYESPAAQMLQQYVAILVETLSAAAPPFPPWWIAQTEQLLMTLFISGFRHNYSHLLEREPADAVPAQVRQAEEYIEANAHRAITLDELARVTGVSAFSLFSAFRKHRGYSPLEFLAQCRSRRMGSR